MQRTTTRVVHPTRSIRTRLLAAIATCAFGAMLGIAVQPAHAHSISAYEIWDKAWTSADDNRVYVHDRECDQALVYANVYASNGAIYRFSAPSCESGWGGSDAYNVAPLTVRGLQVCERANWGSGATTCGSWVWH